MLLVSLFLTLITICFGQISLRNSQKASWQKNVYRIPADTAEYYIKEANRISPAHYLTQQPFTIWSSNVSRYDELPIGNYLIISAQENELLCEYYCQSDIQVFPINNQHRVQLEIKNQQGELLKDVEVEVDDKIVHYNDAIKGYEIKDKRPDDGIIRVIVPGDTLFLNLFATEEFTRTSWQQWWTNFGSSKGGRIISFPVRKVKRMITTPARYWFRQRYRSNKSSTNGYMIFNKAKYQPGDTVKFKAYVLTNKKNKRYKKELDMYLDYKSTTDWKSKFIQVSKPVSPGAYAEEFVLSDSLQSDLSYTLMLKDKKGQKRISGNFRIEDYLLDEVAAFNIRSDKDIYYRHDTLRFFANAKDANGLSIMDGTVSLNLITRDINDLFAQKQFIPDTIWRVEKKLDIDSDTKFELPTANLPSASLEIELIAQFKNSNNEVQEKKLDFDFNGIDNFIEIRQDGAFIEANYKEKGVSIIKQGKLSYDNDDREFLISFPYRNKVNPNVSEYTFWTEGDNGKVDVLDYFENTERYSLSFSRIQQKDTVGFTLSNPYEIPVHYTVFDGNKIIDNVTDTASYILWQKKLSGNKIYQVQWLYYWNGEEHKDQNSIALLSKLLTTEINGAPTVFPGQKDTITVSIKDYKGRPAAGVNLTAVSYNSQFKKDITVKEPPYLQKFKSRRRIVFDSYELDDAGFTEKVLLGNHQQWRAKLGLDTMSYYQLLFPQKSYTALTTSVSDYLPQVAVFATSKGVPQEIYMLYVNREFRWYNGTTDKSSYAISVKPGYTQIAFRMKDRYVEIDSIYLQPFYKYDLAFDIDNLPVLSVSKKRDPFYTSLERSTIENQLWQLQTDQQTNNSYVWQNNQLIKIGAEVNHILGPFSNKDSLQFYKPGYFDLKLPFESGYQYKLSPKIARLERKNIFPAKPIIFLENNKKTKWVLGDTILSIPVISYERKTEVSNEPYLKVNDVVSWSDNKKFATGALKIELPKDSIFKYAILYAKTKDTVINRIRSDRFNYYNNILPGIYNLVFITENYQFLTMDSIAIKPNGTFCLKMKNPVFNKENGYVNELRDSYLTQVKNEMNAFFENERANNRVIALPAGMPITEGRASIFGKVIDHNGALPVVGASVYLKGYNVSTVTDTYGNYQFSNIKEGRYVVGFSSVGYETIEQEVNALEDSGIEKNIRLIAMANHLDEVVVTAYGVSKRKSVMGSISNVAGKELTSALQGKVAGIDITNTVSPGNASAIRIRGLSSLSLQSRPLYVINGLVMDELPDGFDIATAQMSILSGNAAAEIYGSRAVNGVIVITTNDFMPKAVREQFRDYAFWQPNFFTNKKGEAKIAITYPDNVTSWETYVVGMDKRNRLTKKSTITRSFKPLLAQLSVPQFLTEGDSSWAVGKLLNYRSNTATVSTSLSVNDSVINVGSKDVPASNSVVDYLPISVPHGEDTLVLAYTLSTNEGYRDGEIRRVPVVKKGIEETRGHFWILDKDTSFSFHPDKAAETINFYAVNNTLDVFIEELAQLKNYPFYCIEQTASKLKGLLMERQIRKTLKQSFNLDKEIQKLIQRIQQAQLFSGGWSWWEGGEANLAVTNYVTQSLLPLRDDVLVQSNIRNAILYLQNQLSLLRWPQQIGVLHTLSEAGHQMDYYSILRRMPMDSMTAHQQWQVVSIMQQQKLEYQKELNSLLSRKIETIFGGVHWGEESFKWETNNMATTALAFRVLFKENSSSPLLKQIVQYFLERRTGGKWRNTVESAATLSAILPYVMESNSQFTGSPILEISTPAKITVEKFPFSSVVKNQQEVVKIRKSGGGLTYLTASQTFFQQDPKPVTDIFLIDTWFEKAGTKITSVQAGEKVLLKIKVQALKDAEFVQLEIPIPAGCTYAEKKQDSDKMHKEFLKNKLTVFIEQMNKGAYEFEIELEPRYSGTYTMNPAKAELMYFPVYYGRNEAKQIKIVQ